MAFLEIGSYKEALNDFQEAMSRCLQEDINTTSKNFNLFKKLGMRCAKAYLGLAEFDKVVSIVDQVVLKLEPID